MTKTLSTPVNLIKKNSKKGKKDWIHRHRTLMETVVHF